MLICARVDTSYVHAIRDSDQMRRTHSSASYANGVIGLHLPRVHTRRSQSHTQRWAMGTDRKRLLVRAHVQLQQVAARACTQTAIQIIIIWRGSKQAHKRAGHTQALHVVTDDARSGGQASLVRHFPVARERTCTFVQTVLTHTC